MENELTSLIVGSGPTAAVLGYAVYTLWKDNKELRAELAEANRARVEDLKALAHAAAASTEEEVE